MDSRLTPAVRDWPAAFVPGPQHAGPVEGGHNPPRRPPSYSAVSVANSAYDPGTARVASQDGPSVGQLWTAPLVDPHLVLRRDRLVNVEPIAASGNPDAASAHLAVVHQRTIGPSRPTRHSRTYWLRQLWQVPRFSGLHGVIAEKPDPTLPGMGPVQRQRRVLRSAPARPWDAGTALTAAGVPSAYLGDV